MKHFPHIILASASPRRVELLRDMGVHFTVVPSRVEEVEGGHLRPEETAVTNACRKALAVAKDHPRALVIGADTVVALGRRLFGKPRDRRHAARMLAALSGKTHEVVTAVCLAGARFEVFDERTLVTFRRLTTRAIAAYLDRVHVLDKAGAYAIQEHGDALVLRISGSFTNVVGLPVERLRGALKKR
ncbi:MAG: septum formation protein Maf [Planctomycetia bacterium]|nr:septum formation protein Maf [Planctomycetia bacterium]